MPDVQYPDDSISNSSAIRIEDLLAGDQEPEAATPPVREGLPRSFRMRADRHYVEMLDTPPPRPQVSDSSSDAPKAAAKSAKNTETGDPTAAAAGIRAGSELAQSMSALRAITPLLSDRGAALASSVAVNLIRAEVWRATYLLNASRFLRGEIAPSAKAVHAQAIVDQVLKSIDAERRLRGVTIEERLNLGGSRLSVDEELTVYALSGLLMATIALTEGQPEPRMKLSAELQASEVVVAVVQEHAAAPAEWASREVALVAAARIAAACGGKLAVNASTAGTDVRFVLPKLA